MPSHQHSHTDGHPHERGIHEHGRGSPGHTHGAVDPSIVTNERGIWAIKWSFVGLFVAAFVQMIIAFLSGSIGLLADTIHNFSDAGTAIPLWIAFRMARWKPSKRFTYGYGRVEDLAGVTIVLIIAFSAVAAGYESIHRLFHPRPVGYLWAVAAASIVGFLGNESAALLRIKVGREIGSEALIADGKHARVDGFASLAVLVGAVGLWLGYPLADPIVGLIITVIITKVVWESGGAIFSRLLDGVDPEVVDKIKDEAKHTKGVEDVSEVRVRWLGHRLHAELNIAVGQRLSVEEGHSIANQVRHDLLHKLQFLSNATIHVDPANASGEKYHTIADSLDRIG